MMKRMTALLLACLLLTGAFSGCAKQTAADNSASVPSAQEPAQGSASSSAADDTLFAKYAYQASYSELPADIGSVSASCLNGNVLYFAAAGTDAPVFFRFDTDTQELSELDEYAPPSADDGVLVSILALTAAPQGGFWALEQQNADSASVTRLLHFSDDGALKGTLTLDEDTLGSDIFYSLLADADGNLYLGGSESTLLLSSDGSLLKRFDPTETGYGTLCSYSPGVVGYLTTDQTGLSFKPIDPTTKEFGAALPVPNNAWSILPGDASFDLYYSENDSVYGYHADSGSTEKLISWLECDIDSTNDLQNYSILSDGRILAICTDFETGDTQLILLSRTDASTLPSKTEITLACMNLDWNLKSQIIRFNRQSSDYRIIVKDYSEYNSYEYTSIGGAVAVTQTADGLTRLNTEILSGNIPDILVTDGLPAQQYAAVGLLENLWDYIDADENIKRENLMSDVLNAAQTDGKLYELPISFQIVSAAARGKVTNTYTTWTLDDLNDAMTRLQPDATVFNIDFTKSSVLTCCLYMNADSFIDWEKRTCHFDSQDFLDLLNFTALFPSEFDYSKFDLYSYESDASRMNKGEQLLSLTSFYSFDDVYLTFTQLENDVRFVGMPSLDGKSGSCFLLGSGMAITSACQDKNAAWSFIRSLLNERYQDTLNSFPINKTSFEKLAAKAMEQDYETDDNGNRILDKNGDPIPVSRGAMTDGSTTTEIYAMTQEQYDAMLDLIANTHQVMRNDENVQKIIDEEAGAFFAGTVSAEEVVSRIQNRVRLYIAEQS